MNNINDVMDALLTHSRRLDVVMKKRKELHRTTSGFLNAIKVAMLASNMTEQSREVENHQLSLINNDEELLEVIASILEDLEKIDENHKYVLSLLLLEKVEE